ncbi:MAG: GNAT family N-acetyltransferase [Clostridia bacterium]|nr:GNAT family N-acetyltransferase [Clostridia bacterium]
MDYSLIIRRAMPDIKEAEAILKVMRNAFEKYQHDTGISEKPRALLESTDDILNDIKNSHVYIALLDGEAVGSIRVEIDEEKHTAYIRRFGVVTGCQNIGIGKSFMNLLDKLLVSKGVKKATLYTASKYTALVRFYYGCGFYVESTNTDKGYLRALLVKDY